MEINKHNSKLINSKKKKQISATMSSPFQYNKFLMFGDSITEYSFNQLPETHEHDPQFTLGAAFTDAYVRRMQVVRHGFAGYCTRDALKLIGPVLKYEHDTKPEAEQVKIGYIYFGTNDSRVMGEGGNYQHVDIPQYLENMKKLVAEYQKRNIHVLLVTPALHDQKLWSKHCPEDVPTGNYRSSEVQKQYADALYKFATEELKVPCFHFYNAMKKYMDDHPSVTIGDMLVDGIHMSGISYKIVFDGLMELIKENYPEYYPPNMKIRFPDWPEITYDTDFNKG